ncbi:MAG: hypothetical protein EA368_17300 [Leptolyngbya sp. DLM2.Bin27]|nr:MAG: hypothetical protein EA368_17300 [Leptolyngbya sp. DLM2.Bin27]
MAAEQDLLASILTFDAAYPWQPLAPEAEGYLASLEAEFDAFDAIDGGDLEAAIAAGWQGLEPQLTVSLAAQPPAVESAPVAAPILDQLRQFQARIPSGLLQHLAATATTLARSGQPLIDQLVHCVNEVLPDWDTADLAVLARPLAYSLRDGRGDILDLNLRAIPTSPWETLSDLEQARLTLVIASVALRATEGSSPP